MQRSRMNSLHQCSLQRIQDRCLMFSGRESEELRQILVTKDEALNLIDKLKANKSPGPDGIHPRVLKGLKYEIADLLTKICKMSISSASVPEDWKMANVTPIFKKGSRGESRKLQAG